MSSKKYNYDKLVTKIYRILNLVYLCVLSGLFAFVIKELVTYNDGSLDKVLDLCHTIIDMNTSFVVITLLYVAVKFMLKK